MSISSRVLFVADVPQPEQPVKKKVDGHRGRPVTEKTLAVNQRGKPFAIWWDVSADQAELSFGSTGAFLHPTMKFQEFQEIAVSANPLRRFNEMFGGVRHGTRKT